MRVLLRQGFALDEDSPCRVAVLTLETYRAITGSLGPEVMLGAAGIEMQMEAAYMFDDLADEEAHDSVSRAEERGYVNRCVNDIRRRPSQPLIQWRFHPHTVHRDRRLRSTQGPSDA